MNPESIFRFIRNAFQAEQAKIEPDKEQYARVVIDLSDARIDEKIEISGDYLGVLKYTGTGGSTSFKVNSVNAQAQFADEITEIYQIFRHIYLTNSAQTGKELVLSVGGAFSSIIKPASTGDTKLKDSENTVIDPSTSGNQTTALGHLEDLVGTGNVYENSHTMTDDLEYRFETTSKIIRDLLIIIETNSAKMGKSASQNGILTTGYFGFQFIDISGLYFKNATPGSNAKITLVGVERDA